MVMFADFVEGVTGRNDDSPLPPSPAVANADGTGVPVGGGRLVEAMMNVNVRSAVAGIRAASRRAFTLGGRTLAHHDSGGRRMRGKPPKRLARGAAGRSRRASAAGEEGFAQGFVGERRQIPRRASSGMTAAAASCRVLAIPEQTAVISKPYVRR
jgi:hypothetical protein